MGMSVGGSKGGVRSEINVTPLVDIVLVLLIIFLVTMPILLKKHEVYNPQELAQNQAQVEQNKLITVTMCPSGAITIEQGESRKDTNLPQLAGELRPLIDGQPNDIKGVVFFEFGDSVRYGDAVSMIDSIREAGATTAAVRKRPKDANGVEEVPCPGE